MPLYELLCLAKPTVGRPEMARMMERVGNLVMEKNGVLTDLRSYGLQHLAYDIRKPFQRYDQVWVWWVWDGGTAAGIGLHGHRPKGLNDHSCHTGA